MHCLPGLLGAELVQTTGDPRQLAETLSTRKATARSVYWCHPHWTEPIIGNGSSQNHDLFMRNGFKKKIFFFLNHAFIAQSQARPFFLRWPDLSVQSSGTLRGRGVNKETHEDSGESALRSESGRVTDRFSTASHKHSFITARTCIDADAASESPWRGTEVAKVFTFCTEVKVRILFQKKNTFQFNYFIHLKVREFWNVFQSNQSKHFRQQWDNAKCISQENKLMDDLTKFKHKVSPR